MRHTSSETLPPQCPRERPRSQQVGVVGCVVGGCYCIFVGGYKYRRGGVSTTSVSLKDWLRYVQK